MHGTLSFHGGLWFLATNNGSFVVHDPDILVQGRDEGRNAIGEALGEVECFTHLTYVSLVTLF